VAAAALASPSADPVPAAARTELDRIRRRWSELSLDRAEAAAPAVRDLVEQVAAHTAPDTPVPDLGPAVLVDQLAVVVWDACAAGRIEPADLIERLATLRRDLP
jgi:hypothetical protein